MSWEELDEEITVPEIVAGRFQLPPIAAPQQSAAHNPEPSGASH
jgi:hypothetical protein